MVWKFFYDLFTTYERSSFMIARLGMIRTVGLLGIVTNTIQRYGSKWFCSVF
jgi:hypothetical protein